MDSRSTSVSKPRVALTLGDPAGIGPEIGLAALERADVRERMRLVVLGPQSLRPPQVPDEPTAGSTPAVVWRATDAPDAWDMGRVQASCGRAAIAALHAGAELARAGRVDALVTGPVSKAALWAAGEQVEGQTELLERWAGVRRVAMVAIAGRLRVMLLTRHLPLRDALEHVDGDAIRDHLQLFDETLRSLGIDSPRLAVAGLNPHAGEGGLLGREEEEIVAPAVRRARSDGLDVAGPLSPDSVFFAASRGVFDGVLALYHDQAFIPIKLLSEERGITLLAGLPFLRISPVHGTAFDIAGRGEASAENLVQALLQAAAWASRRAAAPL